MNELNISQREMRLAETVSRQLTSALARRKLQPAFSDFYITRLAGMTPLIAVLDTSKIGDHSPYVNPDLLHQLSTDLGGLPVYLGNHSGIRYVVLLSPLPKLPRRVDLPLDAPRGKLAIGMRFTGQPVLLDWETFLHLAVLVIHDDDKAGEMGREYIAELHARFPRVQSIQPPAHDLTDFWKSGGDPSIHSGQALRAWLSGQVAGTLENALRCVQGRRAPAFEHWQAVAELARSEACDG